MTCSCSRRRQRHSPQLEYPADRRCADAKAELSTGLRCASNLPRSGSLEKSVRSVQHRVVCGGKPGVSDPTCLETVLVPGCDTVLGITGGRG